MATVLGNVDTGTASAWASTAWASKFQCLVSSAVGYLRIQTRSDNTNIKYAIYSDGSPDTLLAYGEYNAELAGVHYIEITGVSYIQGNYYWISAVSDISSIAFLSKSSELENCGDVTYSSFSFPSTYDFSSGENAYNLELCYAIVDELPPPPPKVVHVIFDGDSHVDQESDWPGNIISNVGDNFEISRQTFGCGGEKTDEILSGYSSGPGSVSFTDGDDYYLVLNAGTNDILSGTDSANTILSRLSQYWALAKADGYLVVAMTIYPIDNLSASREDERASLNALIRLSSNEWDFLVDVDSISELQDPSNQEYYADGVHLAPKGKVIVADECCRVIRLPNHAVGAAINVNLNAVALDTIWGSRFTSINSSSCKYLGLVSSGYGNIKISIFSDISGEVGDYIAGVSGSCSKGVNVFETDSPFYLLEDGVYWIVACSDSNSIQYSSNGYVDYCSKSQTYSSWDQTQPISGLTYSNNEICLFAASAAVPYINACTDPISDEELATVTGQYFSESGNTLEFGNSSTYSACTVLVEATITAESASEITATIDATGLDVGTVYAYVTNADSLTNETGFEVELTSSGIDCTIDAEITLNGTFPNTVGRLHGPVGGEIATSNTIDITTGRLSTIINTIVASNLIPTLVGRLHTDIGGEIEVLGGFAFANRRGFNNGTMARLWRRR